MENTEQISNYFYQMGHTTSTVKSYLYNINIFLSLNPQAPEYGYRQVLEYISEYRKTQKTNTVQMLASIKKYYDYLIDIAMRNEHPCRNLFIKSDRSRDVVHQDFFTSQELDLLMEREERYAVLKIRNQVVISLLIYQGMITSEVAKMKISHVNLDNGTIFIKESPTSTRRHLELMPKQYRLIDKYINEVRPEMYRAESPTEAFILGKLGTQMTGDDMNYLVSTFTGLFPDRNLNPMTIRQSVITNWLNEKKLPLEQVQLMAGHKWISSTERYRCTDVQEQRELINRFYPL